MKASLKMKLQTLQDRHDELGALLASPETMNAPKQFQEYSKEYAKLSPLQEQFSRYLAVESESEETRALLDEEDVELKRLAEADLQALTEEQTKLEMALKCLLIPEDPHDGSNVFLEIRAGTGGDEAAIFAGDLARMYMRYAESKRWSVEIMSESIAEQGGYKEIVFKLSGDRVYAQLKFESGAHRVQRVPTTESQGRIHTSACTVAILPEVETVSEVDINPADLKVDTYRASGAGGQHVNKTDSAVRITHLPTGVVVECQDERSQHKNRARAMSLLQSKLLQAELDAQQKQMAQTRKSLVGSGDRSERIRTYNYPQGRVTDHRIQLTLYKLEDIMEGALDGILDPLAQEYQAEQLASLSELL